MSKRVAADVPRRSARTSGRQRHILGERGILRRSAVIVAALFSLLAGSLAGPIALDNVAPAYASATSFMVNNEKLRFGGDGHNSTSYFFRHSIAASGMPEQPFYKNAAGKWRKLTYATIPLSMTLGSATGNPSDANNWSGATIPYETSMGINALTGLTIDASGMTERTPPEAVPYGYGTLVVSGTVDLNGSSVRVRHEYELGQNDSFVKATTTVTNLSASPITNGYVWIGTRDDWVGDSDGPTKTRGNIVDGAFSPIADAATASNAIEIKTGDEGVLFYSTTPNTATAINSCCSFINAYGQNPTTSAPTLGGDGSYAISLPLGNMAAGASGSIVWFYAAGAIADLAQIVSSVAAAAAPPVPTAVPGDGSSTLTWLAPSSDDEITGYRIQVTKDGVVQSPDIDLPSTALSKTLGDLVNGSSYTFKVAALTGGDPYTAGTFSGSSLAVTPGAPTAPAISSVTAGNQRLTVAFTAPEHTGGFPISDYEYSTNNGSTWSTWVSAGSLTSPLVITGLTNGTTYQVKLRAKNSSRPGLESSASSGTPISTVPGAPTIASITAASQSLTVQFVPPVDDGGDTITRYEYSTDGTNWRRLSPDVTASPFTITNLSTAGTPPTALTNGVAYPISIRAVSARGNSAASVAVTATPAVPVVAPTVSAPVIVVPPALPAPTIFQRLLPAPPPVTGIVAQNNRVPAAPAQPTAVIGGRSVALQTQITGSSDVSLRAGTFSLGMNVQPEQGSVRQQAGTTEVQVRNGGLAAVSGSGLLPRSTVQVFMPMQGAGSREIARIPVDGAGVFSGDAIFGATPSERPMPIGRQLLQVVTVDENRQQTIVEMTVNIAQAAPAPEPDRIQGAPPTLRPGQSIATNAGEPELVTVTPNSGEKQATVQGDGWSMAVQVSGEAGGVESGADGGAAVTFVRDQGAAVSGDGFMPGTRADVWLFSDPVLLGSVQIDDSGAFNGEVNIDGTVVTVGEHTLQLQGVGADGFIRSANLGVTVEDLAVEVTTEEASGFLWWLWLLIALGVIAGVVAIAQLSRRATR